MKKKIIKFLKWYSPIVMSFICLNIVLGMIIKIVDPLTSLIGLIVFYLPTTIYLWFIITEKKI